MHLTVSLSTISPHLSQLQIKYQNMQSQSLLGSKIQSIRTEPSSEGKLVLPTVSYNHSLKRGNRVLTDPCINSALASPQSKWKLKNRYIDSYPFDRSKVRTQGSEASIDRLVSASPKPKNSLAKIFFSPDPQTPGADKLTQQDKKIKQLSTAIQQSQNFISLVRQNRHKLTKLRLQSLTTNRKTSKLSQPPSRQIYSYLDRQLVTKKDKHITDDIIDRYVKHSPHKKVVGIQEKTRKYLIQKMETDFRGYKEAQNYKKKHIRSQILNELQERKQQYSQDYKRHIQVPYFSYLTLNHSQKRNVLNRKIHRSIS